MFDSPQRGRRRRRIIIPVLVTVVVLVAAVVATSGDDARSTISYLEDVRKSAADLALAGSSLTGLVGDLSRVDRSEFESIVSGVSDSLEAAEVVAATEPPDPSLVGASTLFRLAVDSWHQGIDAFSEAILMAADAPSESRAVDDLSAAVVLVRAGDRIYTALTEELAREDVPSPVAPMPDVALLPIDTPITVLAPAWISAVRRDTSGLALRPSVRIEQVTTKPQWINSADGSVVVEATDALDLIVVVANVGNIEAEPGQLTMTLSSGDGDPLTETQPVATLGSGTSTSIIFSSLSVVPGSDYTVDLELTPGGPDVHAEDNLHSTGFTVNAATTTSDSG